MKKEINVTIREARSSDAESVAALTAQLGYPLPVQDTIDSINQLVNDPGNQVLVAEKDKKVIGWMHVGSTVCLESRPFGEIRGLVIDEAHQRMGIGRELVEEARRWCVSKGLEKLRVRSQIKRKEAHTFYLNFGFTETKTQKVFDLKL